MFNLLRTAARPSATRVFSSSHTMQAPTVAVVLSGSGVYDGSEIHEASAALASLTRAGAEVVCYAPDTPQLHVINHIKYVRVARRRRKSNTSCLTQQTPPRPLTYIRHGAPAEGESRNVLVESARIARGAVKPITELSSSSADAVFLPGGFGAAKNLSDFAVKGGDMSVNSEVERVLKDFHGAKKPIGLCCIAPIVAAKVLGTSGVTLTLGKADDGSGKWPYAGSIEVAKGFGANAVEKNVDEVAVDEANRVVTTPAYMYEGKFHEIHDGVAKAVAALLSLIK